MVGWWFVLMSFLALVARILGQLSTEGFISIDCGLDEGSSYKDQTTGLTYCSDDGFIDSGVNNKIHLSGLTQVTQLKTLRSFPNGTRNCYSFTTIDRGTKLLIRASFRYGNYDGQNNTDALNFDLWLGAKFWATITPRDDYVFQEVITVVTTKYLWVCLVNTGNGNPFISSLELRPLDSKLYPAANESQPLILSTRWDYGSSAALTRYPDDQYDRFWLLPTSTSCLTAITTDETIGKQADDLFQVPPSVMQTAVTPCNDTDNLRISWHPKNYGANINHGYYYFMHFADFQKESTRTFQAYINQDQTTDEFTPMYLQDGHIYSPSLYQKVDYEIILQKTNDSLLPPLINAMEFYQVPAKSVAPTDPSDVDALMSVKEQYRVKKNWMGDPCAPQESTWDGVNCNNYSNYGTPRVMSLTLSSSGLTGGIPFSLAKLGAITSLDLSDNNLTGTIPDFLADLPSLNFLNLSGNQLTGSVPDALTSKYNEGSLRLSIDGNPNICINGVSCEMKMKKKKKQIALICSLTLGAVVLVAAVFLAVWVIRRRKSQGLTLWTSVSFSGVSSLAGHGAVIQPKEGDSKQLIKSQVKRPTLKMKRFKYAIIQKMTDNFKERLGSGGFGSVYHGIFKGRDVAVKIMKRSEGRGIKFFRREAKVMFRTDHENVVKLIGFCNEGDELALVSECMAGGDLLKKLTDGARGNGLGWEQRLRIASGAAKGLEYLHDSEIIHRDVKSSNILLDENLEAKVADFGLSKICNSFTFTSTVAGHTPGYDAPEVGGPNSQTKKTDVFSFGVVLLELITGKPALFGKSQDIHISDWVKEKALDAIVDSRLNGVYDVESVEKVKNLADMCMELDPNKRPDMSTVVMQLMPYAPYENPSTSRPVPFGIEHASSSTGP